VEKAVPELVAIARPATLTRCKIDRAEEPDDVNHRGTACGGVEVVEPPGLLRQRELLDVRVAVEADDRHVRRAGEGLADARGPGAIDEPEIGERISSQSI